MKENITFLIAVNATSFFSIVGYAAILEFIKENG